MRPREHHFWRPMQEGWVLQPYLCLHFQNHLPHIAAGSHSPPLPLMKQQRFLSPLSFLASFNSRTLVFLAPYLHVQTIFLNLLLYSLFLLPVSAYVLFALPSVQVQLCPRLNPFTCCHEHQDGKRPCPCRPPPLQLLQLSKWSLADSSKRLHKKLCPKPFVSNNNKFPITSLKTHINLALRPSNT